MVSQENTGKAISVKCHFLKVKSKYGTEKKMHPYSLIMSNRIKASKQDRQTSEHTVTPALAL